MGITGFLRFGKALRKHTIDSMEKSMVTKPQRPMPGPWIFAVVSEIWVRFREYWKKAIASTIRAMMEGLRFRPTKSLRRNSGIWEPDFTAFVSLLMLSPSL